MGPGKEKFALITGCGDGGIGHALANNFVQNGFIVIATLLPHESRTHLEHAKIHVVDLDVTKEDQMIPFKSTLEEITGGTLDVLVNNAGICYTMTAADTDVKQVEKMFAVNVFGPMRLVHHLHRMLIAAPRGVIVNIGSIGGVCPYVFGASYNATKAALHHWGNTLRVEMKPFGVHVVNIISGEVATNILKSDVRDNRTLPEDSVYAPLAQLFRDHVNRTPDAMSPDDYARGVVAMVQRRSLPAWFWHGNATGFIWTLDSFFPRTIWDWLFTRWFKLKTLVGTQG
ncbi:RNA elimination defective protein Red1 [Pyricularia oryzae]|uniref:RNA elimination defective protein Red1 n=2 Tax=Pyricularia grisea TaxID=148305 RepID=A0ABQ8NX47_PYRGI|nr:RNA elimination defective protein Red1 [Pyricularia oryzae]KAI6303398.1 RNA elimination defective protein Red1 [Pyricularia grisea]KAI6341112.1 RNA elimination defective protein Red1 [Pyricularia oryzae]KAI6364380.1 RNA elimination defective protein Red1 [Pyricularia oryzae]KAI6399847.1 RNA elimination defective protein Red1 [Pyricularia oryzae]